MPIETIDVDLRALSSAFSQRLRRAGMPVTPPQAAHYASSLTLTKPESRHRLYATTRAIFATDLQHIPTFDRVFAEVFGSCGAPKPVDLGSRAGRAGRARLRHCCDADPPCSDFNSLTQRIVRRRR